MVTAASWQAACCFAGHIATQCTHILWAESNVPTRALPGEPQPAALHLPRCTCRIAPAALHLPRCTCRIAPVALHLPHCTCRVAPAALHLSHAHADGDGDGDTRAHVAATHPGLNALDARAATCAAGKVRHAGVWQLGALPTHVSIPRERLRSSLENQQ
eukprot:358020-Chlamydomonas_euryale.AAC.5